MGDLAGWPWWKVISITGQAGAGTDYQIKLEIGDSAGGDFHLEGHCTNFPQDLRITDDDGTTLLDYWVEDLTADPIVIHVEVKDDLGSNQDIRVYYGKSGETTASDIETTFLFGDDFPGSSIDTSKWDVTGIVSVADSKVSLNQDDRILGKTAYGYGYAVHCHSIADEQDIAFIGLLDTIGDQDNSLEMINSDSSANNNFDLFTTIAAKATVTDYDHNDGVADWRSYRTYIITRISGEAKYYVDGNLLQIYTNATYLPTVDLKPRFRVWDSSQASTLTCDWVFVKKYNSPEPAFSSAGAEQTILVPVFIRHNPALTGGMV